MSDFISEDDLRTFEGWLRYQAVDASTVSEDKLVEWRRLFEDICQRRATAPKVGLMKFQPVPGEYRYGVALRDGADLWLTLWFVAHGWASSSSCYRAPIKTGIHIRATTSAAPCT